MQKIRFVAKAAIINDAGEVLVLTRSATDKTRPGDYDFAGGRLDEGEEPTEAVLREIAEEVGITLTKNDVSMTYTNTDYYENSITIRFFYIARVPNNQKVTLSFEHSGFEWMTCSRAIKEFNHPIWAKALQFTVDKELVQL